ncbi:hypothetical protein CVT25_001414 [Psilocybe cyanescens]|uniref:Uncharacterized protein n=1 Tax=Psilocybe cyanescens TaxID=93625 RepID=A0A409WNC1_PSICY|nr:hypothetical protein CVT25_001414 [Psilocybe cyanescens]
MLYLHDFYVVWSILGLVALPQIWALGLPRLMSSDQRVILNADYGRALYNIVDVAPYCTSECQPVRNMTTSEAARITYKNPSLSRSWATLRIVTSNSEYFKKVLVQEALMGFSIASLVGLGIIILSNIARITSRNTKTDAPTIGEARETSEGPLATY